MIAVAPQLHEAVAGLRASDEPHAWANTVERTPHIVDINLEYRALRGDIDGGATDIFDVIDSLIVADVQEHIKYSNFAHGDWFNGEKALGRPCIEFSVCNISMIRTENEDTDQYIYTVTLTANVVF